MTPEQRDAWFCYHAPTPETAPKYAAIREAERVASTAVDSARFGDVGYDRVNAAMLAFAESITEHAPPCADRSAAIRCVRLARNAANEAIMERMTMERDALVAVASQPVENREPKVTALADDAIRSLRHARWQANSAIACGGI